MPFNNDYKLHDINNTIHVQEIYETRHSINSVNDHKINIKH